MVAAEPGHEDPSAERRRALAAVDRDYPPWRAWPGVLAGVMYARRPNTSPPMVVRAITPGAARSCDSCPAPLPRQAHQADDGPGGLAR
jgi:hypothetical protein